MPFKSVPKGYQTWQAMKQRCLNPNSKAWPDYGGRGIEICDRWIASFQDFISDMGVPPKGMSIERKNNSLGYYPGNCEWATRKEQQRNRRVNVSISITGKDYMLFDLMDASGVTASTIKRRVKQVLSYAEVVDPTKRTNDEWSAIGRKKWSEEAKSKTHCIQGHEFTEDNTYITKEGWKRCRTCHNAKIRRYSAAKREAASRS